MSRKSCSFLAVRSPLQAKCSGATQYADERLFYSRPHAESSAVFFNSLAQVENALTRH